MSRTTTVASPATVPMTRLSPAGTVAAQCTSDAMPVDGVAEVGADGVEEVSAVDGEVVDGACAAVGFAPPQAASASIAIRATPLARTPVTVAAKSLPVGRLSNFHDRVVDLSAALRSRGRCV